MTQSTGRNELPVDGIVLVHGGHHDATCWQLLAPLLDLPATAVDLPGRGARPVGDRPFTIADLTAAVIADADAAGFDRFVLVGHSMGGLAITQTAVDHPTRVAHLVYVGALTPPVGVSTAALFGVDVGAADDPGVVAVMPEDRARAVFAQDATDAQWDVGRASLVDEPIALFHTAIAAYPTGVAATYVQMSDDNPVPLERAATMIAQLGPDVDVRTIDAAHNVMLSQPEHLAAIVNTIVSG